MSATWSWTSRRHALQALGCGRSRPGRTMCEHCAPPSRIKLCVIFASCKRYPQALDETQWLRPIKAQTLYGQRPHTLLGCVGREVDGGHAKIKTEDANGRQGN